jgi:glycosyltransferase involved in cell wall biosynthesis
MYRRNWEGRSMQARDRTAVRFITRKWPPAVGGMETYSVKIVEGLRERGAVDLIALPGRNSGREPTTLALLGFGLRAALKLLLAPEARVVHVADLASWPLAWMASVRHRRSGIVISAHGSDLSFADRPGWRSRLYRAYLRMGAARLGRAHIIANSHYIAGLVGRAGFANVSVVPLATDLSLKQAGARQHLLYAGRISRAKGLRFLVEQVVPLLPGDVRLRVAGAVWEESERPLLCDARVEHLGVLSADQLAEEFGRAAAVLIPTRESEGFGLVAIEAAACGTWVIASDHSGLAEIARAPIGVAVDADDPQAWAAAIRSALSKTEEARNADTEAARAEIDRRYRWPRVIDDTLAIYEQEARR